MKSLAVLVTFLHVYILFYIFCCKMKPHRGGSVDFLLCFPFIAISDLHSSHILFFFSFYPMFLFRIFGPISHCVFIAMCACSGFVLLFFYLPKHNYINVTKRSHPEGWNKRNKKENNGRHMVADDFISHYFIFCLEFVYECGLLSLCYVMQRMYTLKVKKCSTSPHISWIP